MTGKSVRHMCASAFAAVCCLLCGSASFKPFSAAICTVPASDAEAVAAKLAVKKLGAGIVAKLVSFDNGDGTVTLSADCGLIGMHVIVRQMG